MKNRVIICFYFIFSIANLFAQPEPVLSRNDLMQSRIERSSLQFLKINLVRTYRMEIDNNEITGRKALISELYYDKNACPSSIVYFDSIGNSAKYTHYIYNADLNKTEEIYFENDSSIIGGIAFDCNRDGITRALFIYDKSGTIASETHFSFDTVQNRVVGIVLNNNKEPIKKRIYHFDWTQGDGLLTSVETLDNKDRMTDSTSFVYNEFGLLSMKRYFNFDRNPVQESMFYYNDNGAIEKSVEVNLITGYQRSFSYAYDEFGNRISMIESDKNNNIISFYRFEYFSQVKTPNHK